MKILIFGAKGQVGTSLVNALKAIEDLSLCALDREDCDFTDTQKIQEQISLIRPDLVINCCAYTAVDKAESDEITADLVNHTAMETIGKETHKLDAPVIHISTDYVYTGEAKEPYQETDETGPLSVYGKTKLLGDLSLTASNAKHIILRTSWVFGEHGANFVKTMLRLSEGRDEINVVSDQRGRPTYSGDIVASIVFFVEQIRTKKAVNWGIYHCSSNGETNWYEFAVAIFAAAKVNGLINKSMKVNPIPTSQYPTPAPRPLYSVLNTQKLEKTLGHKIPHWNIGLEKVLSFIKAEK